MKNFIKMFALIAGCISMSVLTACFMTEKDILDNYSVIEGQQLVLNERLPVSAKCVGADSIEACKTLRAGEHYTSRVELFGVVPIKNVNITIVKETKVVPCGEAFGIKLYTAGVLVVGMSDVDTAAGSFNPANRAGIRTGDIILAISGKAVCTNTEVGELFAGSGGKGLTVSYRRGNIGYQTTVTPVKSVSSGTYKAGLWVRDSTAGIGTMTYYDAESGLFGGLGHGICDTDTGKIMPLLSGDIVKANLTGILKGTKGQPGELQGTLDNACWGSLGINTETGVYGKLNTNMPATGIPLSVAMRQQVHSGPAKIIAMVDASGPKAYNIEIDSIDNTNAPTKNMIISVTDTELLKKTGGIVQGMSGCPIIQDGLLAGAVTHVFVNDPQMGYGIFAENMINSSKVIANTIQKDVS